MTVRVYKSTDTGAPVLTGQVGELIDLLRACLVTGYDVKVAAGWSEVFVGTNISVFRSVAARVPMYLRVDDNAPNATAAAREAQARGYEVMTSLSVGSNPFPTVAQLGTSGVPIRKSTTADATARPWKLYADESTFYLFTQSGDWTTNMSGFAFGDIYDLATKQYRAIIAGRSVQNSVASGDDRLQSIVQTGNSTLAGHWISRNTAQAVGALAVGKHGCGSKGSAALAGIVIFPNTADSGKFFSNVWVHEVSGGNMIVRGRMRGFWQMLHPVASIAVGDILHGVGPNIGRTFEVAAQTADGSGRYIIETSNTWETNGPVTTQGPTERFQLMVAQQLYDYEPETAAATFPSYAKPLIESTHRERASAVDRSQREDGMVVHNRRQSRVLVMRPFIYKLISLADYQSFITWFEEDTDYGVRWFNWTDPVDGQTKLARFMGGKIDREEPVQGLLSFFKVSFTLETWDR